MSSLFTEFRDSHPGLKDLSDDEVASIGASVFKTSPDDFKSATGYEAPGDVWRGIKQSGIQAKQLGAGLLAAGAAAGETAAGEGGLLTGAKKWAVGKYQEYGKDVQRLSRETDSATVALERANQGDFGALVDFVGYAFGQGIGQGAQALASGGLGGIALKTAGKSVADDVASGLVKKEAAKLADAGLSGDELVKAATAAATQRLSDVGQTLGVGAFVGGLEGGEIGGRLAEKSVEENRALTPDELAKGLGAAVVAGTLEFIPTKLGYNIAVGKSSIAKAAQKATGLTGVAGRASVGAAATAPLGAATEYAQTYVEEYGKGEPIDEKTQRAAFDAAAIGAVGEGSMGAIGSAIHRDGTEKPPPPTKKQVSASQVKEFIDVRLKELDFEEQGFPGEVIKNPDGTTRVIVAKDGRQLSPQELGERLFLNNNPRPESVAKRYGFALRPDAPDEVASEIAATTIPTVESGEQPFSGEDHVKAAEAQAAAFESVAVTQDDAVAILRQKQAAARGAVRAKLDGEKPQLRQSTEVLQNGDIATEPMAQGQSAPETLAAPGKTAFQLAFERAREEQAKKKSGPLAQPTALAPDQSVVGAAPVPDTLLNTQSRVAPGNTASATELILPDGKKVAAQWAVVEAEEVKASLKEGVNQPRDRTRALSDVQVSEIAKTPDFERLSDTSKTLDYGAPTLTTDGVIVGGNGRFEGVSHAYRAGSAIAYRKSLEQAAERFGLSPATIAGMKEPVLVRRLTEAADTRTLAIQSNQPAGLQLSDVEQAAIDAERMQGLEDLDISDNGEIPLTEKNQRAIGNALKGYTTGEVAGLVASDGALSQSGMRRVRNAILHKAYGKSDTLSRLIESADPDLKIVGAALVRASARLARVRERTTQGKIPENLDITNNLKEAVEVFSQLKAKGLSVDEYFSQDDIFSGKISDEKAAILRFLADNSRSAKNIAEYLNNYANAVLSVEQSQGGMFGDAPLPTQIEVLDRAGQRIRAEKAAGKAQRSLLDQDKPRTETGDTPAPEADGRPDSPEGDARGDAENQAESKEPVAEPAKESAKKVEPEQKGILEAIQKQTEASTKLVESMQAMAQAVTEAVKPAEAKAGIKAGEPADTSSKPEPKAPDDASNKTAEPAEAYQNEREASDLQNGEYPAGDVSEAADNEAGQLDLFVEPSADKRQAYADLYGTVIKARTVSYLKAATDVVKTAEDLSHLLASIRKEAQEALYAVVTDKRGKVLRVMRHTKGLVDQSPVSPITLIAEAASIPGAHRLHLGHNHPSGDPTPSSSDANITDKIRRLLDGTGVILGSHVVIGQKTWQDVDNPGRSSPIQPRARTKNVAVTERAFVRREAMGEAVSGPESAARITANHKDAVFLFNNRHYLVGIVPLTADEMKNLRAGGRVNRLLSAINTTNAMAAIVKTSDRSAATNIVKFLNSVSGGDFRTLDWISGGGVSAAAENNGVLGSSGPFFSRTGNDTITVDGVERPTTNSEGQPIHPTEAGVRNFWRWFGNSRVVDDQGRPLVVYRSSAVDSVLSGKPQVPESGMDGLRGNAKLLSNLLQSPTFRAEGLGGFDAPTQGVVLAAVRSFSLNPQILGAVVELVPVDVVDILAMRKASPDSLFRDDAVLKNLLSVDGEGSISTAVDVADALVAAVARVTTEASGVSVDGVGPLLNGRTAGRAGEVNVFMSPHDGTLSAVDVTSVAQQSSATGNRGTYSPASGNISMSRRSDAGASTNYPTNEANRGETNQLERYLKRQGREFTITPVLLSLNSVDGAGGGQANRRAGPQNHFAVAEQIASLFGKRVVWINAKGPFGINGVVVPGGVLRDIIFIDANTQLTPNVVLGHELSHHMEADNPKAYADLLAAVKGLLKNHEQYRISSGIGRDLTDDAVIKEMLGDIVGDNFGDAEFWNLLGKENPGTIRRIANAIVGWIDDIIAKLTGKNLGSSRYVTDLKAARAAVIKAVGEYATNKRSTEDVRQTALPITDQIREGVSARQPLFSRTQDQIAETKDPNAIELPAKAVIGDIYTLPPETRTQKAQRKLQDEANRFQVVQDAVVAQGGTVKESTDMVRAIKRYPGRLAAAMKDSTDNLIEPLLKRIQEAGLTVDEIELLAYAEHAYERNEEIAKINPRLPNDGTPGKSGSGMTDGQADAIIEQARAHPDSDALFAFAEELRDIADRNLDNLVAGGVMAPDQAAAYRAKYKKYIPLKGFELVDDRGVTQATGAGLSTGKKIDMRAYGRSSRAGQLFENVIRDYEKGLQLVEKANVARVIRAFVEANPDDALWTIDKAPKKPYIEKGKTLYQVFNGADMLGQAELVIETSDKKIAELVAAELQKGNPTGVRLETTKTNPDGIVRYRESEFDKEEEIRFIENGQEVRIQLTDEGMVRSYNRLWHSGVSEGLTLLNTYNAWLRQMYTQKNPSWFIRNFVRDVQSVVPYVTGEVGLKVARKIPGNIIKSFKAAWAMHHNKSAGDMDVIIKQFMASGAYTGFAYVGDIEAQTLRLNGTLARYASWLDTSRKLRTHGLKAGTSALMEKAMNTAFFSWIEAFNSTFENTTRLAVFKSVLDSGESVDRAGDIAKHASTNFNTRGEWGPNINAVWLFSNASFQGTRNIVHALMFSPHKEQVWGLMGGLVALGYMASMLSDDDDDLLDDQLRSKSLIFKAGDSQVSMPMSYGFGFFAGFGQLAAQAMKHPEKRDTIAIKMATLAADHFSPLGNPLSGELSLKNVVNIAPTFPLGRPMLNVLANVSPFGGAPLYPDSPFDKTKPDSEKMWQSTKGTGYAAVAEWLNTATGGDKYLEGGISVSPQTLKLGVSTVFGGAGRLLSDVVSMPFSENLAWKETPVAKDFYREIDQDAYLQRFYEQAERAENAYRVFRNYQKATLVDDAIAYQKEEAAYVEMGRAVAGHRKQIKYLKEQEALIANGDMKDRAAKMKQVGAAIISATKAFNDRLDMLR